jgi:hypothetical protein
VVKKSYPKSKNVGVPKTKIPIPKTDWTIVKTTISKEFIKNSSPIKFIYSYSHQ